uniref:Uncharacterized protein n=1 Tax=Bionectria ochroleuca TaxID=29856 RepID=A0A8H7N3B3_BIOOC
MKFATTLFGLLGSAAMASAATVTFWTLDDQVRTVTFTSNENRWPIAPVTVSNKEKTVVTFPDNYVGNWYSTIEGEAKAAHPFLARSSSEAGVARPTSTSPPSMTRPCRTRRTSRSCGPLARAAPGLAATRAPGLVAKPSTSFGMMSRPRLPSRLISSRLSVSVPLPFSLLPSFKSQQSLFLV